MHTNHNRYFVLIFMTLVLVFRLGASNTIKVSNLKELNEAQAVVRPGDHILLANGTWKDVEMVLNAKGTAQLPVYISAEEKGKVFVEGMSNLRISGLYLEISGLVFRAGFTPTDEVISFREKSGIYANHCRLTECVIDNYNNPDRFETEAWIALYGKENRVDHCYLVDKRSQGVTLTVQPIDALCCENKHLIDHNYFGYRQNLGSNGGETMRLGTSPYSLSTCGSIVEANYFDHCDGEHEIISNKSCGNLFKDNTFYECRGTLTFRHGHDNLATGNFFFGNGVEYTGGIRVINERNSATNNYLYQLKGYRFRGALVIMNGVPNSPINRYNQVVDAVFSNNTYINCDHILLCAGSDKERSATPLNSKIENNIFYHDGSANIFTLFDDISGINFANNYLNEGVKPFTQNGFANVNMKLATNAKGIRVVESAAVKNAGCNLAGPVAGPENTGVKWYPRKSPELSFDKGQPITVEPGLNTLFEAVRRAKPGDVLLLKSGKYLNNKNIAIRCPITIKSSSSGKPVLMTEKNSLFTIENEGALRLAGLEISGKTSPDMAGNSIVATSKYSMNRNYKLRIENCVIADLDVNYGFDFLKTYKSTMADSIVIRNCQFTNVTGHIMELDQEYEDLGIYNAECVVIENSTFSGVQNSVLSIYRGGTDESTSGPRVTIQNSSFSNCGKGKRNKGGHVLYLHGVQSTRIDHLSLIDCAVFRLFLTEDEPITKINGLNIFPKADIVSNRPAYELTGLTHQPDPR